MPCSRPIITHTSSSSVCSIQISWPYESLVNRKREDKNVSVDPVAELSLFDKTKEDGGSDALGMQEESEEALGNP